jgi:hypothetical protein
MPTVSDCESQRTYTLNDGDLSRPVGIYACEDCGRAAELHPDP